MQNATIALCWKHSFVKSFWRARNQSFKIKWNTVWTFQQFRECPWWIVWSCSFSLREVSREKQREQETDSEKEMNSERYKSTNQCQKIRISTLRKCFITCLISFSNNLDAQTVKGNTALHYCCLHNKTECLKLLLKAKANTHISEKTCLSLCPFIHQLFHNVFHSITNIMQFPHLRKNVHSTIVSIIFSKNKADCK